MKRKITAIAAIAAALVILAGCASKQKHPFDYDLSKYVTLGKYIGVEYTYDVAEVTDGAVEEYIHNAMKEKGYGEEKEITDRTVRTGDTVNIDFVGKKDGVAFPNGTANNYELKIGSRSLISGFEDGLIGAAVGEKRVLDLTFPDPYPNDPDLAGQAVQFEVTVNSIKAIVYPELTDELAAEISDFKTKDEFVTDARTQVALNNSKEAESKKESDVWNKVIESCTYNEIPKAEIDKYKDKLLESYDRQFQNQYGASLEEYLSANSLTIDDIQEELTAKAEQAVKNYMTVIAIGRDQDLLPTDEEYQKELEGYAAQNGYKTADEFKAAIDEDQFYMSIVIDKVMDFVVENAVEKSGK